MPKVTMTFPEGKHKVLTMSYDDGRAADRRLVDLFNKYGIKATFHINSGMLGEGDRIPSEELEALYRGHEVSAHTLTHPTIARCPNEQIVFEIVEDRTNLERIVGYPVKGLSYPNGSFNKQIKEMLPHLGIEYARSVESHGSFMMPDDYMEWRPTCHHKSNLLKLAEDFIRLHKKQYLYMMYVWGHSYEFDLDHNWELMERFCELIGMREDIWFATNIEIIHYINAFGRLQFSASMAFVYNPSFASVWLEVDGAVREVKGGTQVSLV
ncbi:polysaccharide deacetylase family protein [Paenibacillus abyssi]|uniref:Polysaccharide deacetylase n=1 Tax=Paenibacillus abyssi TaxID=1340531 RepID=A0A917D771_9BACL|nr:polysaccharide deacetylase family protein [Paenibacillus abyssi]GGG13196.1 polysaccharide deacetylase [Paenibacillus abyssi]